jgi:elongation factor 1-gamma
VATLTGVTVDIAAEYKHYEDNKKPEFLSRFPHGKIPALETKDGFRLFEGTAIARYSEYYFLICDLGSLS